MSLYLTKIVNLFRGCYCYVKMISRVWLESHKLFCVIKWSWLMTFLFITIAFQNHTAFPWTALFLIEIANLNVFMVTICYSYVKIKTPDLQRRTFLPSWLFLKTRVPSTLKTKHLLLQERPRQLAIKNFFKRMYSEHYLFLLY